MRLERKVELARCDVREQLSAAWVVPRRRSIRRMDALLNRSRFEASVVFSSFRLGMEPSE
jgi:hypothetical protein